jgi:hypothetical protein
MTTGGAQRPLEEDCFSKEIIMKAWMASTAMAAALTTGAAQAGDVSWSVTVGSPRPAPRVIYTPPPVIYTPPPVVYHPAPVVYAPPPVIYAQPRVIYTQPRVVYAPAPVYHVPPGHAKHWYKHHHKHHGMHGGYAYPVAYGYQRRGRDDD